MALKQADEVIEAVKAHHMNLKRKLRAEHIHVLRRLERP